MVPWDAQLNNPAKAITLDQLKEFSRRSASKHILMVFDANLRGWDVTAAAARWKGDCRRKMTPRNDRCKYSRQPRKKNQLFVRRGRAHS